METTAEMNVPFLSFDGVHGPIKDQLVGAFGSVLDSGWFVNGNRLEQFEQEWGDYLGGAIGVGVSNGLDGLELALRACGVGDGDEVLVPSHTYVASFLAISHVGGIPVPVECSMDTGLIDVGLLEAAVTDRTKAIMPVHLYGQAVDMTGVMDVAQRFNLKVVEDNAQAQGCSWKGKRTGAWGHANSTSFYPGKNLGALGDGGAVTTTDPEVAKVVRILRNYGSETKYVNDVLGYNKRLDELQAAFLSVKLRHLDGWTQERKRLAARYDEMLDGVGDFKLLVTVEGADHVYHLYVVRTAFREPLVAHLKSAGVGTLIHYPIPPHLQKCYGHMGWQKGQFPVAEELAETVLSLPLYPGLTDDQQDYAVQSITEFFKNQG